MAQLIESLDVWTRILDDGMPVDVVYLEFAKAFDSVLHRRLLIELKSDDIQGHLLNPLKDLLIGEDKETF